VNHGGQLQFNCPEAADIAKITLIRASSVTHEIDSDQRSIPLGFTVSGSTLSAQVPADTNLAPAGFYMLFAVNKDGVPSIAPWVRIA
jgi:hypothetical protein